MKFNSALRQLRHGDEKHGNDSMRMYRKAVEIQDQELANIYFEDLVNQESKEHPQEPRESCEHRAKHALLWMVHYMTDEDKAKRNFKFYDLWGVYEERKNEQPEFMWLREVIESEIQ